jgi:hypothetical protein
MAPRWRGLRDLGRTCPIRIRAILTDRAMGTPSVRPTTASGRAFTDRLFGLRRRAATGAHAFDRLCNQQLPQSAPGSTSPLQALKDWHNRKPPLFRKQPCDLPGCASQVAGSRHGKPIRRKLLNPLRFSA